MAIRYKKGPDFVGKTLTLMVGRGDMKILDHVEYDDQRLAKFVGQGFMVRVPGTEAAPAPAAAPAEAPAAPPKDEPKAEGSTTKTPATKRKSGGRRTSTKSSKK